MKNKIIPLFLVLLVLFAGGCTETKDNESEKRNCCSGDPAEVNYCCERNSGK